MPVRRAAPRTDLLPAIRERMVRAVESCAELFPGPFPEFEDVIAAIDEGRPFRISADDLASTLFEIDAIGRAEFSAIWDVNRYFVVHPDGSFEPPARQGSAD